MSNESALLKYLVESGKITQEEIEEAKLLNPPKEITQIVDLLHLLFCEDHADDVCKYHEEAILPDLWQKPFHKKWLKTFYALADSFGYDEFIKSLPKTIAIYNNLTKEVKSNTVLCLLSIIIFYELQGVFKLALKTLRTVE